MIEAQTPNTESVVEETTQQESKLLTVSQILEDLDNGLDRKAIQTKYGLTGHEVKVLFTTPALKGKRPKRATKKVTFTLIDDTNSTTEVEDNVSENANDFSELTD